MSDFQPKFKNTALLHFPYALVLDNATKKAEIMAYLIPQTISAKLSNQSIISQ